MIRVEIRKNRGWYCQLQVSGHARSGDFGRDMVCAAVSSIMTGSLNGFDQLDSDNGNVLEMNEKPKILIAVDQPNEVNQILFEFVIIQLKTIAEVYDQYISIIEKEVTK